MKLSIKERAAHLDSLSNFDIMDLFDGRKGFGGVKANNELQAPKKGLVYILNLQNLGEPGSHWTLLYNGWYFDSYGVGPTKDIARFTKSYNKHQYQGVNKESCGFYTAYVADHILNGLNPVGDLIPGKVAHNERILKKYFIE